MKKIELLAPAKNIESGMAAINYGADAVYIGSPKFGARVAAGNSIEDIKKLASYAHHYNAQAYVTINTILHDQELEEVKDTIHQLYHEGIDAIIIQDMGILEMDLPPIPLFASTQTNNYTWQKVKFLEDVGLQRIILARELSLNQIKEIRSKTNVDLEFFVHGALCVSLSGQCYFSHAINKGSANRGACAQPCRAYYSLKDKDGKTLIKNKHLLSLKDFNLSNHISALMNAGISSFKIEGRLKDLDYVKNITSYYRKEIDRVLEGKNEFQKSSSGKIYYDFTPDPEKTFNRGYTNYFLKKKNKEIASPDTPKSKGKLLGIVKSVHKNYFILDSKSKLHNGDGICFFNSQGNLIGTKINRVENQKIFPDNNQDIKPGVQIFRNFDIVFSKQLASSKTERKISTSILIEELKEGILITATDENLNKVSYTYKFEKEAAKNQQKALKNLKKQFLKAGDSIFKVETIELNIEDAFFLPISEINSLRRKTLDLLLTERLSNYEKVSFKIEKNTISYPEENLDYKNNVINKKAILFYKRHGVKSIENAFEVQDNFSEKEIMITKHCLKYELGSCPKYEKNPKKINEPIFLEDNNRKYKLEFDCESCFMKVIYIR